MKKAESGPIISSAYMNTKMDGKTAIRFRADIDKATRTITISRQVWAYKPESAQGHHGNDGEWQMRTRPGQYGFKNRGVSLRGSGGALVRATGEEVAGMPRTTHDAVEAFRAMRQEWADRCTRQAQAKLEEAAEHRDQAAWLLRCSPPPTDN
jgi:hypothetical protein